MEVEYLYRQCKAEGLTGLDITREIDNRMDISLLLKKAAPVWDGGYAICGMTGSGESFCVRDPWGIRPTYYYVNDEIVVVASERPVIQTVMNVPFGSVNELQRGNAIIVNNRGSVQIKEIIPPKEEKACSFERIYFSRGSDAEIYKERKNLGRNLVEPVLKAVHYDFANTVYSFIPNTAEVAYFGMLQGLEDCLNKMKKDEILALKEITPDNLGKILSMRVRSEKVAIKDIKLRTFIAEGKTRNDMAAHVYDVTYGTIRNNIDNLVVIDDSIVRGTTLKQSIIKILDRLHPKKIVIVSSSPQVRYPDCYGIDMSSMGEFIAFKAAMSLIRERKMEQLVLEIYNKAKLQDGKKGLTAPVNYVKELYAQFSYQELSDRIAQLLISPEINAEIEIVYQDLEGLHNSCPHNHGDWYFTGDYPTPGGMRWVNKAFIDYIDNNL